MFTSATSSTVTVSRATGTADYRRAAALLYDYAHWIETATGLDPFVEQPSFARELCDLARVYDGDDAMLLLAREVDVPVATVAIVIHGGRAEVKRLYVRPSARGRGMARAMLERAIAVATEAGCGSIWLESLSGAMDPAIALYRSMGFADAVMSPTIGVDGIVVLELELG